MKENQSSSQDRHLQTPSEANRDKHINFRQLDEDDPLISFKNKDGVKERRDEWQRGLEEGERAKNQSGSEEGV